MRNKLFSLLLVILFVLGVGVFVKPQNTLSKMEKRALSTNNQIVLNNTFSQKSEAVLKDQFYFRDALNKNYYSFTSNTNKLVDKSFIGFRSFIRKLLNRNNSSENSYYYLSDEVIEVDDNYLLDRIPDYSEAELELAKSRGYNITEFNDLYPNIKTYVYYITHLEEIMNDKSYYEASARKIHSQQLTEDISYDYLKVNNIEDHKGYFYRTDEHWKASGAYEAYKDIINMISNDYEIGSPKQIKNEKIFDYGFTGDIAGKIGGNGVLDYIDDYELENIQNYEYYVNNNRRFLNTIKDIYEKQGNNTVYSDYDLYFGDNYFLREFRFNQEDKPNLLIFGDSFVNSNMLWIASHFNNTYIIDLRKKDDSFSLNDFINEHDIDVALVMLSYNTMYINGHLYIPLD